MTTKLRENSELLISSLEKAQAELKRIAEKLEQEFHDRYDPSEVNPTAVLARIHKLQRELPIVTDEARQILTAKAECIHALKTHLVGASDQLQMIQHKTGMPVDPSSAELSTTVKAALADFSGRSGMLLSAENSCASLDQAH
jgi:hypothetical protein